eukprot:3528881-Rhodomonas_salina.1
MSWSRALRTRAVGGRRFWHATRRATSVSVTSSNGTRRTAHVHITTPALQMSTFSSRPGSRRYTSGAM